MRSVIEVALGDSEPNKITSSAADPTSLVIVLFVAGAVMIVYGLNGIRVLRVSMTNVSIMTEIPLDESAASPVSKETAPLISQDGLAKVDQADVVIGFLERSSWIGLLTLKACALAQGTGKKFGLRQSPLVGEQVSYDYVFAYIIASIALGVISGAADPVTGTIDIKSVHRSLADHIDRVATIRTADPTFGTLRTNQLATVVAYFRDR